MKDRLTIHFVDPSTRVRAEQSGQAFDLGYHAEVYSGLSELVMRPLSVGLIIARDDPATGGIARFIREIADMGIWLPVVATSEQPQAENIVIAMKAGALDYLSLPLSLELLDATLSRVGEEAVEFGAARRKMIEARERISNLSEREREVLDWLTKGSSNKAIARELHISPRTVEIHRANMMSKLGAKHAAEAVRLRLEAQIEAPRPQNV